MLLRGRGWGVKGCIAPEQRRRQFPRSPTRPGRKERQGLDRHSQRVHFNLRHSKQRPATDSIVVHSPALSKFIFTISKNLGSTSLRTRHKHERDASQQENLHGRHGDLFQHAPRRRTLTVRSQGQSLGCSSAVECTKRPVRTSSAGTMNARLLFRERLLQPPAISTGEICGNRTTRKNDNGRSIGEQTFPYAR